MGVPDESVLAAFVTRALQSKLSGSSNAYTKLVTALTQTTTNANALVRWVDALNTCAERIQLPSHRQLVYAIIGLDWEALIESSSCGVATLLVSFAVCHGSVMPPVVHALVKAMRVVPAEGSHSDAIHGALLKLSLLVPAMPTCLSAEIDRGFPHPKHPTETHLCYLAHVLRMCVYLPQLRDRELLTVTVRLTHLDVCTNWTLASCDSKSRLNVMMSMVLDFLNNQRDLFASILRGFETAVLHTHGSRAVQFLTFFLVSRDPLYCEILLKRLIERVFEPTESTLTRETCAHYIASFLSRAVFLRRATLYHYFDLMVSWTESYEQIHLDVSRRTGSLISSTPSNHRVYYAVCNAIFYVYCKVLAVLHGTEDNGDSHDKVVVRELIHSSLNPIRHCNPIIIQELATLFCSDPLFSQRSLSLGAKQSPMAPTWPVLMPFDSCQLSLCSPYFSDIYRVLEQPVADMPSTSPTDTERMEFDMETDLFLC